LAVHIGNHPRTGVAGRGAAPDDETRASVVFVTAYEADSVLRFNADTGEFLGAFVPTGSGGLNGPTGLTFGPDGHLYVASFVLNNNVLRYDGRTGAFLGVFVESGSGGLQGPVGLSFGPNGDLYVAASYAGGVFRYDGGTGAFRNKFTNGPEGAESMVWHEGDLFVSGHMNDRVIRGRVAVGRELDPLRAERVRLPSRRFRRSLRWPDGCVEAQHVGRRPRRSDGCRVFAGDSFNRSAALRRAPRGPRSAC
jgi:hypothetical protein